MEEVTEKGNGTNTVTTHKRFLDNERNHFLLLIGITVLGLGLFAGKAFHVDDTLFIWCGQHIQQYPLDPYGFTVNWFGTEMPMHEIMRNPPLMPYYLAIICSLIGWSEPAVHLALLLPAIACVLGFYSLAKRWTKEPLLAALIGLFTPAFFVSSTTAMCDTTMLAFEVWAIIFWIRAHETRRTVQYVLSALFLAAAALTKFTGLTIIPLLLVYSVVRERKFIFQTLALLLPVAAVFIYLIAVHIHYGGISIWDSLFYATSSGAGRTISLSTFVVGLSFTGGCFLPVLFFAPALWRWKYVVIGAVVIAAICVQVVAGDLFSSLELQKVSVADPLLSVQLIVFVVAGLLLLTLAIRQLREYRSAESVSLGLLVIGTIIFTIVISWSISARYLLPLTPAVGILLVRSLKAGRMHRWRYLLLIPSAIATILVAMADYSVAESGKTAALEICTKYKPATADLWFQGHWGFQYYMEQAHAKPLDGQYPRIQPGDLLVYPLNNSTFPMDRSALRVQERFEYPVTGFVATMSPSVGAGFYAHVRGPFPFAFGNVANEKYFVLRYGILQP